MYDVTCEKSFNNIRYWIHEVEVSNIIMLCVIVSVCLTVVLLVLAWYLPYTVKNGEFHNSLSGVHSQHPVTCNTLREFWCTPNTQWEFCAVKNVNP